MNEEETQSDQNQQSPAENTQPKTHNKLTIIFAVIALVLALACIYLLFFYKQTDSTSKSTTTTTNRVATTETDNDVSTVSIKSVGYPYEQPKKMVTTTLVLPNKFGAVRISSSIQNPGLTDGYTDKFNDEMGRWVLGDLVNNTGGDANEISLIAISNSWLNKISDSDNTTAPHTVAEKKKFLVDIKAKTTKCASDKKSGFVTAGKVLNVCYVVESGLDSYAPTMTLQGYGELDGKPYYMEGVVRIYDRLDYDAKWQTVSAQVRADFAAKKYPSATQKQIDSLVSALAKTQIILAAR